MPPRRRFVQKFADDIVSKNPNITREDFMYEIMKDDHPKLADASIKKLARYITLDLKAHDVIRSYQRARQKLNLRDEVTEKLAEEEKRYIREDNILPTQPPKLF